MSENQIVGYREFVDGSWRPIYDDGKRQWVINDDGDRVYGVFLIPRDEADLPLIVRAPQGETQVAAKGEMMSEPNERAAETRRGDRSLASLQAKTLYLEAEVNLLRRFCLE
jgi:hypothetical protein